MSDSLTPMVAGALLGFSLLFFNPLLVFFSDPNRLGDLPLRFVYQQLGLAVGLSLVLGLLALRLGRRYAITICFLCLVAFAYSYVVQIHFGLFRGNRFTGEDKIREVARIAYLVEPVVLGGLFWLVRRVFDSSRQFFLVFFAVFFASVGYEVYADARRHLARPDAKVKQESRPLPEELFSFSRENPNILLIVPDAGAGYILPNLMAEGDRASGFDGFVHYRNTLSVGSYTLPSAAALIAGPSYTVGRINERNEQPILRYIGDAYRWLGETLQRRGVEGTFVNPVFVGCVDLKPEHTCVQTKSYKRTLEARYGFEGLEVFDEDTVFVFALFKALPFSLKAWLYGSPAWEAALESPFQLAASVNNRFYETLFLKALPELSTVEAEAPTQFIHLWDSELIAPFFTGAACQPLAGSESTMYSHAARIEATGCLLDQLAVWFEWLSANDVYDNTKIIIAADHGAAKYGEEFFRGAAKPILLVKDFGSRGPLASSDLLLQNSDVIRLICAALDGCEGIGPDPIAEPEVDRVARYYYTQHGNEVWAKATRKFEIRQIIEVTDHVDRHPELQQAE